MSFEGAKNLIVTSAKSIGTGLNYINPFGGTDTLQKNNTLRHPITALAFLALLPCLKEGTKIHFLPYRVVYITPGEWQGYLRSKMDKITKSFANLAQPIDDLLNLYDLNDNTVRKLCEWAIKGFQQLEKLYRKQEDSQATLILSSLEKKIEDALKSPQDNSKFLETTKEKRKYLKMQNIVDTSSLLIIVNHLDELYISTQKGTDTISNINKLNNLLEGYDKIFEYTMEMLNIEQQ